MTDCILPNLKDHPDLSVDDILALLVPQKHRVHDKELFGTKWWDYKFLTSTEATMLYVSEFGKAARKIYAQLIDYEKAQHIKVITPEEIKERLIKNEVDAKKAWTSFWRGRQMADAIGCPYDFYLSKVMDSRMRNWQRAHLPNPNQLYRDKDAVAVYSFWDEVRNSRTMFSTMPQFQSANYTGEAIQDEYYAYLVDRASATSDKLKSIAMLVKTGNLAIEFLEKNSDRKFLADVRSSLEISGNF